MAGNPRVLVLAGRFPVPSETFVAVQAAGLARRGFDVTLAAFETTTPDPFDVAASGVRVVRVPEATGSRLGRGARALRRGPRKAFAFLRSSDVRARSRQSSSLARVMDDAAPDLVFAHFGPIGLAAAEAPVRVPLVVDFHGFDVTSWPRANGWRVYDPLPGVRALGVCHSGFVERTLREHLPIELRRVPLGVDLSRFAPESSRGWGAPLRLVVVARLVPQKGVDVAIRALSLLHRSIPGAVLTIVGEGAERASLERVARSEGVSAFVTFLGARRPDEVASTLRAADVLLVPSRIGADGWQEAFCVAAVEGLASGLLVIGTTTGGLAETIGDGGVTVPPDDAAAMADAVVKGVAGARGDCVGRASARARAFPVEAMTDAYEAVVRDVLGRSAAR